MTLRQDSERTWDRFHQTHTLSVALVFFFLGAVGFWSVVVFASIALINFFTSFLVMIRSRRQSSVAFLRIADGDILRFTILSGVFGAWFATFCKYSLSANDFFFCPAISYFNNSSN